MVQFRVNLIEPKIKLWNINHNNLSKFLGLTHNQEKNGTQKCECMSNCKELSYQAVTNQIQLQPNNFTIGSL